MILGIGQSIGNPEWGYWLDFSPTPYQIKHLFCGENNIVGGNCIYCQKPLLRILTLDASDHVLNMDATRHPAVHLFYCWTCSIPYDEFSYKIKQDGSIEILKLPKKNLGELGMEGPYEGYTGVYPLKQVSLIPLTEEEQKQELTGSLRDLDRDIGKGRHQIGGFPYIFNPVKIDCLQCRQEMPLLACIEDNAIGNGFVKDESNSFVGNSGVQMLFHFCRNCSIVSATHSCD
jgi:hypothetical protein